MRQNCFTSLLTLMAIAWLPLGAQSTSNPFKFPSEGGVLIGATNYAGDIVKKGDYDLNAASFSFGVFYRLYTTNSLSWRFGLNQGRLKGNDLDWEGTDRVDRGFSFSSPLTEITSRAEYDFLNHRRWSVTNSFQPKFSFYLFVGAGVGFISPKTTYNDNLGSRYDLLIAEDEKHQGSVVFTIPFGGGIKIDLSERWIIGGEFGLNPVFNDYLDGISASANPKYSDWYSIGGLTLSYRLQSVSNRRFFIRG